MMKDTERSALLGKIGVTDTELRPSGTVLVDGEIYDAKTDPRVAANKCDSFFIEVGRGVRITRVKGKKIFVIRV